MAELTGIRKLYLSLLYLLASSFSMADQEVTTARFLHPAGLELIYPSSWRLNDSSFADIELVPPDQNMSPQGPTEAYFLWGLGLDSSQSKETQIFDQLKELMEQIASFLKPAGEPEAFLGKKVQGYVYSWKGKRPDGNEVLARIFVLPQKDLAFALVALGVSENILKRESIISEIFGSLSFREFLPDSKLAGHWISIPDESENNSTTDNETKNEMELNPDGSFRVASPQSQPTEEQQDLAGSGRWYSLENKIYFVSPHHVALTFHYELLGESGSRRLNLLHSNGDRQQFLEHSPNP